jgi:hypothetical protein
MLVKEHRFKFHIGNNSHTILVEEYISHGAMWREKFKATVQISRLKSKEFYASTLEGAAGQAATYLLRIDVHPIDRTSLRQIQLRQDTGTHGE